MSKKVILPPLNEASKRGKVLGICRGKIGKRKIEKANEQNIILSRDHRFVPIAAAVALKRQSTWDLSRKNWKKEN